VILGCVFVLTACSATRHPAQAATLVYASGRIGKLQIGSSGAGAVIAFAGRPDSDRRGRQGNFGVVPYRALGYDCSRVASKAGWPLRPKGPYCQTVFWINLRTRRLGDFYTTSPRYEESHGVRIGMATATAERVLHQRVYVGCEENLGEGLLAVAFTGGVGQASRGSPGLHLAGGHVYAFAAHGGRSDIGVFDCL